MTTGSLQAKRHRSALCDALPDKESTERQGLMGLTFQQQTNKISE